MRNESGMSFLFYFYITFTEIKYFKKLDIVQLIKEYSKLISEHYYVFPLSKVCDFQRCFPLITFLQHKKHWLARPVFITLAVSVTYAAFTQRQKNEKNRTKGLLLGSISINRNETNIKLVIGVQVWL